MKPRTANDSDVWLLDRKAGTRKKIGEKQISSLDRIPLNLFGKCTDSSAAAAPKVTARQRNNSGNGAIVIDHLRTYFFEPAP
jgi:hypothetical protein